MSLTDVIDVDIHIISFCDLGTITKLLFMRNTIEKVITIIIEHNQDDLIYFIIDLIDLNEIILAKQFIIQAETMIQNSDDLYYHIVIDNFQEHIIKIYLDVACDSIINYFRN